jgi:hypothetical protein
VAQPNPPVGHFVLADISGFTAYLAEVELAHARGVLRDLLELIVADLAPPLSLASVEGDAIFAYLPAARLTRGETLLEILEAAYRHYHGRPEPVGPAAFRPFHRHVGASRRRPGGSHK